MLNHEQKQSVDGGSIAAQAGRDVVITSGVSAADVISLCEFLWKSNFPVLREEARRVAEENVQAFAVALDKKLKTRESDIETSRFADPDIQAAISDAVKACARRGEEANPDILSSLITEKVSSETDGYMGIVFSEAVQVVPRLTSAQISLLSVVMLVTHMAFRTVRSLEELEALSRLALRFSEPAFGLPPAQKRHIHYTGAAMVLGSTTVYTRHNLYESKALQYGGLCAGEPFSIALHQRAPSYAKILDQYLADKLEMVTLNSVGQAIALANISRYFGRLNFESWLNSEDML